MSDLFRGGDQAHARRDDPATSHEAAGAVTPDLRALQARVVDFAKRAGARGFTDAELSEALDDATSTFRTRRAELTARNIILDSGMTRRHGESTRSRIVWVHRDYFPGAPPIVEPPEPIAPADRAEARRKAAQLAGFAISLRKEGRTALADELQSAADLFARFGK